MHITLSILAVILSLILVIGIHEAGHALAARCFNVKIKRISIGFGRPLFCWKRANGVEWVWSIWPLGGYVHLLNTRVEAVSTSEHRYCFDKKPAWVRCIILLSGALANVLAAWFALLLMLMIGYKQMVPVVDHVQSESIAAEAGLMAGDRITSLAGHRVSSWQDVGMHLIMVMGQDNVPVLVENKAGVSHQSMLSLHQWHYKRGDKSLLESIGIEMDRSMNNRHDVAGVSLWDAGLQACTKILELSEFFLMMLKQLITGVIPFMLLLGPVGMVMLMVDSFFQGFAVFLYFIAHLSLAVALVNLFPVPGIDGGSLMYTLIEKIRGKPMSVAMELLLYRLAFIGFGLLFVQLILNDFQRSL